MKTPTIDECPCCGVRLLAGGQITPAVKPKCMPITDRSNGGRRQYYALWWVCQRCGCEWMHEDSPETAQNAAQGTNGGRNDHEGV